MSSLPKVPAVKLSLSLEGLPWLRLAEHLGRMAQQPSPPDAVEVTLMVGGTVLFHGLLASLVNVYPSGPPHVQLAGGLVKLDALEFGEPTQVDVTPLPVAGSDGAPPAPGSAAGKLN